MSDWLDELEEALDHLRIDRLEALSKTVPAPSSIDAARAVPLMARLSVLANRGPEQDVARLGWLLSAVVMQPVVTAPRSRGRAIVPLGFIALSVVLGLLLGRMVAAGVMAIGLVVWAARYGGTARERHGAWLRLGETVFDLRTARVERLGSEWLLLEGRRVPIAAVRDLAPELLGLDG